MHIPNLPRKVGLVRPGEEAPFRCADGEGAFGILNQCLRLVVRAALDGELDDEGSAVSALEPESVRHEAELGYPCAALVAGVAFGDGGGVEGVREGRDAVGHADVRPEAGGDVFGDVVDG